MRCNLKDLLPNPLRDFAVDPLDNDQVSALTQSVKDHTFWENTIVCRKVDNEIQVIAGWHRVKAAIKAGVVQANITLLDDADDVEAIKVYAREDATQKGRTTAQTGAVAAAIRYLAKAILTDDPELGKIFHSSRSLGNIRKDFEDGMGWHPIVTFLDGCPGINEGSVRQQLALLKSSGDYARIIQAVTTEIEVENEMALEAEREAERERQKAAEAERERQEAEARAKAAKEERERQHAEQERKKAEAKAKAAENRRKKAEERSKKHLDQQNAVKNARKAAAAAKANKTNETFDLKGCQPYFDNAHQLDVFRKCVTSERLQKVLPVNRQAALAKAIVEHASVIGKRLSEEFIRTTIDEILNDEKRDFRKHLKDEERDFLARASWEEKAVKLQRTFASEVSGVLNAIDAIVKHNKERPAECKAYPTSEFRDAIRSLNAMMNRLNQLK